MADILKKAVEKNFFLIAGSSPFVGGCGRRNNSIRKCFFIFIIRSILPPSRHLLGSRESFNNKKKKSMDDFSMGMNWNTR